MDFIKRNLIVIIMTLCIGSLGTLTMTLYANQNKAIDGKANKDEVVLMIEKLEAIREQAAKQYEEEKGEQKRLNQTLIQTLQQLNIQILLLNEKLKKGEGR